MASAINRGVVEQSLFDEKRRYKVTKKSYIGGKVAGRAARKRDDNGGNVEAIERKVRNSEMTTREGLRESQRSVLESATCLKPCRRSGTGLCVWSGCLELTGQIGLMQESYLLIKEKDDKYHLTTSGGKAISETEQTVLTNKRKQESSKGVPVGEK